jgi:hypothetical protein
LKQADLRSNRYAKLINQWHVRQVAYMLEKMRSIKEGDGNLLDHSMVLFGAGMRRCAICMSICWNAPAHRWKTSATARKGCRGWMMGGMREFLFYHSRDES